MQYQSIDDRLKRSAIPSIEFALSMDMKFEDNKNSFAKQYSRRKL